MIRFMSFLLMVCVLAGCGGGNGGGPRLVDIQIHPDVIPPSQAAPPPSSEEMRSQLADIEAVADRLRMTDVIATSTSRVFANERAQSDCLGTSCTVSYDGLSLSVSLSLLSDVLPEQTVNTQHAVYGVNRGSVGGKELVDTVTLDYTVLGGWLEKSFFGAGRVLGSGTVGEQSLNGFDALMAFSAGQESQSNPISGSAIWRGLMVGLDRTASSHTINGEATLTFDFGRQALDVAMTNIKGERTYDDMNWNDLPVRNGEFSYSDTLSGSFYGSNHEEVGGVFERNHITGAFGASRQ